MVFPIVAGLGRMLDPVIRAVQLDGAAGRPG
jgi:hypothetical protein